MTPEQWAKVNELFHAAIEQAPEARAAWLTAAIGHDPAVLHEVHALIDAHEREPDFLDESAPAALGLQPSASHASALRAAGLHPSVLDPSGLRPAGITPSSTPVPGDRHADAPSLAGRRIGAYQVTREIGRGGMGVVYLAHDTRLGRDVAIKALPRDRPLDAHRRERLRREARAAAALAHPNIATVYALEEDGDELYLVTEFVRGSTLRDELHAQGPLTPARLVDTAIEITRAIGAAHAEGIVHRDLKPDNVMRTPAGSIKVLDFGLARAMAPWPDEEPGPTLTRSGMLLGTPAYMAPEQIRGERADGRADLFATGVMLYELATGVHPFDGTALGVTLHRILTEAPASFASRGVLAPPGLWPIVECCLQKELTARYATAENLLRDLLRVQAALPARGKAGSNSGAEGATGDAWAARPGTPPPGSAAPDLEALRPGDAETFSGRGAPQAEAAPAPRQPTPFSQASTETTPASSEWWWQFHQVAVVVFFSAVVVPAWRIWHWIPWDVTRLTLRVATLVVIVLGVSLRLHLWFLSRYDAAGLLEQRPRAAPWMRAADAGFSLAMLAGGLAIMAEHPDVGAVFLGLGIVYAVVFLMIEPATSRAAFRER